MSTISTKSRTYRFVNYIFIFLCGLIVSLGFKYEVKATQLHQAYSSNLTIPTDSNYYDEQTIYNIFNDAMSYNNLNFDFSDYSHVRSYKNNSSYNFIFSNMSFRVYTSGTKHYLGYTTGSNFISISVNTSDYSLSLLTYDVATSSTYSRMTTTTSTDISRKIYSTDTFTSDNYFQFAGLLDFSVLQALEFNEDLFEDDPNFKYVCTDVNKPFAITRNDLTEDYYTDYDFIWFPYSVWRLYHHEYSSYDDEDNVRDYSDTNYDYYEFLGRAIRENFVFNDESEYNFFAHKGYFDNSKTIRTYYGYSAFRFSFWYDFTEDHNDKVFTFFTHGSPFSFQFIGDEDTNNWYGFYYGQENWNNYFPEDKVCFYIKNEYIVQSLNTDEYGDFFGIVSLPGGDSDISTSFHKNNLTSTKGFAVISSFLNHIGGSVNFVKDQIFYFYDSLPFVVKMFILSVFYLIVIKLILGMVVK